MFSWGGNMFVSDRFKRRPICAAVNAAMYSMLLASSVHAAPTGGQVVGGAGSINQSGVNTTINQASQNMAINWQSYNVNTNERVQYIQPNASSISLNRILSNNGSTIAGRIDANGQVILVNPNGIFFTPTSVINVGGIIASGLDISPSDFMNGNYMFNEVVGTDGAVVNTGTINASLGGNVALIGRQVENDGLIAANLGSVTLAAGKQAVLTFDNGGVLGVRVSKAILQDELGVDPAVINKGDIQAAGGRVLLTASTSQDVFSQAVNTNGIQQATSVVVNTDGTFTLGTGADTVNTGSIDTSTSGSNQNAGRVVMLGNNVTSSGAIKSDAASGNGGEIELHSTDTTLLTQDSMTSARSDTSGKGGIVKVLGNKVGLFDQSTVDVSGATGGGQALIGGDEQGNNSFISNSSFLYTSDQSQIHADGIDRGNGGKIITFATNTANILGGLFARGGDSGGDGGFIETSGLRGFQILKVPDVSSQTGAGGLWLIDPYSITISNTNNNVTTVTPFEPTGANASLDVASIQNALRNGDVKITTVGVGGTGNGDITFDANGQLSFSRGDGHTLTFDAAGNIELQTGSKIYDGALASIDSVNVIFLANGSVTVDAGASIITEGGNFYVGYDGTTIKPVGSFINNGLVDTSGASTRAGGNIQIYTSGDLTSAGFTTTGGVATNSAGLKAGNITLSSGGNIDISAAIIANGSDGERNGSVSENGGIGGVVSITATGGSVSVLSINTSGGKSNGGGAANGGKGGNISLSGGSITLNNSIDASGGISVGTGIDGNGGGITFTGPITLTGPIAVDSTGTTAGNIIFNNTLDGASDLTLAGGDITFGNTIGSTQALGVLTINSVGNINANSNAIKVSELQVNSGALSFQSGDIDTSSTTTNGGAVTINARDIQVGGINTSTTAGASTGGAVALNAIDDTTNGTPTITLNGDINATGATNGAVQLVLSGAVNPQGTVTLNYSGDFTSPATIAGSTGTDTLNAANRANSWVMSNTSGTLNSNLTFSNVETLVGNAGIDTFVLPNTGNFSGSVNGNGGSNDEVRGGNQTNIWSLTGASTGTVTGLSNGFSNIQILTGGTVQDSFNLSGTSTFSGSIDGGGSSAGADGIHAGNRTNTWAITGANAGTVTGLSGSFSNITHLTGNAGQDNFILSDTLDFAGSIDGGGGTSNTLTGGNRANNWTITGQNSGTVTGLSAGNTFANIQNLNGNSADDTFVFSGSGAVDGTVNGGSQVVQDTADYSSATHNVSIQIGQSVVGIERFIGNNDGVTTTYTSELIGSNVSNTWNVTGINSGDVNGISFVNFNHLTGNTGADQFIMGSAGAIDVIDGVGTSGNTLVARSGVTNSWHFTDLTSGSLEQTNPAAGIYVNSFTNIQSFVGGGGGNEWADFSTDPNATVAINVNSYIGFTGVIGNGANSTLTGINNQTNTWEISSLSDLPAAASHPSGTLDGINDGVVNRGQTGQLIFVDFSNLTGGGQNDTFTIQPTGNVTGLINGAGGTNTITVLNPSIGIVEVGSVGSPANLNVTGFNTIIGNGTTALMSDSSVANNTWTVMGANSGTLNGTTFDNFNSLLGGTSNDIFILSNTVDFTGSIDGGTGTGTDELRGGNRISNWEITNINNTGTVTGLGGNFSNIETLTGNAQQDIFTLNASVDFAGSINGGGGTSDQLRGGDRANTWTITGANTGTVTGLTGTFANIDALTGGSQQDNFVLNDMVIFAGTIDGGAGIDELRGGNRATSWTISGTNSGTVSGLSGGFANIEQLTGNANQDIFILNDTIAFNGSLDGGGGTNDELRGGNQTNTWTITGASAGTVTGLSGAFSNIELLTGNAGQDNFVLNATAVFAGNINGGGGTTNTLTGGNRANTWTITSQNGGTVTGLASGNTFANIQNLTGNANVDTFNVSGSGTIDGLIDGAGSTQDTVDYSAVQHDLAIQLGTNIAGIERVVGNNNGTTRTTYNSELIGPNRNNTWTVSGQNSGDVNGIAFQNFNNLTGNVLSDSFVFGAAGNISGIIDGGDPVKTAWIPGQTWTPWTAGTAADVVDMSALNNVDVTIGQDITNIELVIGSNTNNGTLRIGSGANNWDITGTNTGIVNSTEFRQFNALYGGIDSDRFYVEAAGVLGTIHGGTGNDYFTVNSGASVGSIYGDAGDDTFDIQGTVGNTDGGAGTDYIVYHDPNINITVGQNSSGFEGVTAVNGGTINARDNTTSTWNITGIGAGNVSDTGIPAQSLGPENLAFSGFTAINGGNGTDIFNVSANGAITGLISGRGGADRLNLDLTGRTLASSQLNYDGGGDIGDTILITGPANTYAETYATRQSVTGLSGVFDQLGFSVPTSSNLAMNYRNVSGVTDNLVVDTLTVNSADAANVVELGPNTLSASNHVSVPVDYLSGSKHNITVAALNGGDVSVTGNMNIPGMLTLTADAVTNMAGASITADSLFLQNTNTVGGPGNPLATNISHLQVENAGPVYIQQQGNLDLAGLNTAALVNVNVSGNATSNTVLVSSGELVITATGDVGLTGANQLTGPISLSEGNTNAALNNNTFTLNNTVTTTLGDISVMNLTVMSGSNIVGATNSAVLVTGQTSLAANGDIALGGQNNDFNTISVTQANNVLLADVNDVGLVSLANANSLPSITSVSITSGGKISDANNGGMNIVADSVSLNAADGIGNGSVDYDSNTHAIPFNDVGAIHTQTGVLSAINLNPSASVGAGTVNINNNAPVIVNDLRNNGDIILNNNSYNVTLAVTSTTNQSGQIVSQGAIDANYHGNVGDPVYAGSVALLGSGTESIYTLGRGTTEADITAQDLLVYTAYQFGDKYIPQPIRLRINRQFSLYSTEGAVAYTNGLPSNPVSTTADLVTIEGVTGLSGQQMIDIESLGDVDPAIFTEVRNYNHEDVAILLPEDQRLSDENDEECRDNNKKCKRQHGVN
ncbi:MAG: filamentous hemagglutinin N-terminal domain-containing protein [Gammaproteobacteria bacterium]|nr:filamentous hemagglutinin N-terminal domain-containing protein [Gammaproteobacteria bacterium]